MKTAAERYAEAMDRLDDNFADGRLHDEWVASIEAAVAEERARCARLAMSYAEGEGSFIAGYFVQLAQEIESEP